MSTQPNAELIQFGLAAKEVQQALGVGKVRDVDYADRCFESCLSESVM